jgi:hypothetical protein
MQNAEHETIPTSGDLAVDLVPLALIAIETNESIELVADRLGEAVQLDDIGVRSISAESARRSLAELAEQRVRQQREISRRRAMARPNRPILAGSHSRRTATQRCPLSRSCCPSMQTLSRRTRTPDQPAEEFLTQRLGAPREVVQEDK